MSLSYDSISYIVDHDTACKTCVLTSASGLTSVWDGYVTALSFGGRVTGVWLADSYSCVSVVTGVDSDSCEGHAYVKVFVGGSCGVATEPFTALAGVIENVSTVVMSVCGMIASKNVVCEFETADSVYRSCCTGVWTDGEGIGITITEGADWSGGVIYLAAIDWTESGIHTSVFVTRGGMAIRSGGWADSAYVPSEKSDEVGTLAIEDVCGSIASCKNGCTCVADAAIELPFGPLIDS